MMDIVVLEDIPSAVIQGIAPLPVRVPGFWPGLQHIILPNYLGGFSPSYSSGALFYPIAVPVDSSTDDDAGVPGVVYVIMGDPIVAALPHEYRWRMPIHQTDVVYVVVTYQIAVVDIF